MGIYDAVDLLREIGRNNHIYHRSIENDTTAMHFVLCLVEATDSEMANGLEILCCLCQQNENAKSVLALSGVILHLVSLLKSTTKSTIRQNATKLLGVLGDEYKAAIVSGGGIDHLVNIVWTGNDDEQSDAVCTLSSLAHDSDMVKQAIASSKTVSDLIVLLRTEATSLRLRPLRALQILLEDNIDVQKKVADSGVNRYLTEMLHNEELRETALRGLCVFAKKQ